jgi:hypothetical protein
VVYDSAGDAAVYTYDAVGNLLSITTHSSNQLSAFQLSSNNAQPGSTLIIYGTDFCSAPSVTFNGIPATVISATATEIVVSVPSGASTGEVQVTCGSNSINAGVFETGSSLTPSITSFTPASGGPGTLVTISGSNLQDATNVLFNGYPSLIAATSSTSLTVVVPSDAVSGPITVINQYGMANSCTDFGVQNP